MLTAIRVLLLLVASSLLASSVSACGTVDGSCAVLEVVVAAIAGTPAKTATVYLTYDTTGAICDVTGSSVSDPLSTFFTGGSGTVQAVVVGGATLIKHIDLSFTTSASNLGRLVGQIDPLNGATITYPPYGLADALIQSTSSDSCVGGAAGDPKFRGFFNQQFHLIGQNASVYNLLSNGEMQFNARLIQLNDGDSMTRSQMRVFRLKSAFTLPNTEWFSHAGPYMVEFGLAMLNGHQLYAQAGGYEQGWASVLIDDVAVPVSEDAVVLGAGSNAIRISHTTAHQLVIDSQFVQLTITNSDHFFNIDDARLKQGFSFEKTPMDGALGQTANPNNGGAKWRQQIEELSKVQSGDLFDLTPAVASSWSA